MANEEVKALEEYDCLIDPYAFDDVSIGETWSIEEPIKPTNPPELVFTLQETANLLSVSRISLNNALWALNWIARCKCDDVGRITWGKVQARVMAIKNGYLMALKPNNYEVRITQKGLQELRKYFHGG